MPGFASPCVSGFGPGLVDARLLMGESGVSVCLDRHHQIPKGSPCNVVELTRTIGCVLALSWLYLYSLKASSKGLMRDYRTCRVEPSIRSEMKSTCQHRGCRFKV